MNALRIDIDKEMGERIKRLGGSLPAILDFSASEAADDLASYIRDTFLTGKALEKRTGETYSSVMGYKAKRGEQGHFVDFGVGVRGHLNYIHKWSGSAKDFMGKGGEAYEATGRLKVLVERNLERMEKRLEVL
ncbi:hypothetical protein [uncultured Sphaerochaeta sp.]|uniref:hypothetical protein n=1 Tax=uncultured Sphaerochaeta sp. TaxID=886478 RepID=UPI002AA9411A|nr:hypothetical protein [uncultured Sphaerochaeta sp.]